MTHIQGQRDDDLHDKETGEHISTARTANGRDLERHESRVQAHLAGHAEGKLRLPLGNPNDNPYAQPGYRRALGQKACPDRLFGGDGAGMTLPEPPNNTRIEFEFGTDLFAAMRDDDASRRAGWPAGDGGETWCLYGESVPMTWTAMVSEFGENALRLAVRLTPMPEDLPNRDQWATARHAHEREA